MTKNTGTFQKWSLFIAGLLICSFGDSMNFKASIGVTPYEATQLTAFFITGIKVGTLAIISNFILLGGQLLIRKKMTPSMLLQIPLCVLQGYILNLIIYTIFGKISLNYPVKVVFLLCGIFLSVAAALFFSRIMNASMKLFSENRLQ